MERIYTAIIATYRSPRKNVPEDTTGSYKLTSRDETGVENVVVLPVGDLGTNPLVEILNGRCQHNRLSL